MFRRRRYEPNQERHRWFLFLVMIGSLVILVFFLGLRTVQVALSAVLAYYVNWILRKG